MAMIYSMCTVLHCKQLCTSESFPHNVNMPYNTHCLAHLDDLDLLEAAVGLEHPDVPVAARGEKAAQPGLYRGQLPRVTRAVLLHHFEPAM